MSRRDESQPAEVRRNLNWNKFWQFIQETSVEELDESLVNLLIHCIKLN